MKATANGKTYDTEQAEELAWFLAENGTDQRLYRTDEDEFFLVVSERFLDGRLLGPYERLEEMAPELFPPMPFDEDERLETRGDKLRRHHAHRRRVKYGKRLVPATHKEALAWCVKTQIPDCFKGYLIDCL